MHKDEVEQQHGFLFEVSFDLAFPTCIANMFSNHYFLLPAPSDFIFLLEYLLSCLFPWRSMAGILSVFKYLKIDPKYLKADFEPDNE